MSVKLIGNLSNAEAEVNLTTKGLAVQHVASELIQTLFPAANTGGTITLPAVAGQFHYITSITIGRSATAALTGNATLSITTTNLPGSLQFRVGNAMVAGGTQRDVELMMSDTPLKSSVANTATTIVLPTPGAAVLWGVIVTYFTAA